MIVDSHCHLNMKEFSEDLDIVIANAVKSDVRYMQTICTKLEDFPSILEIAEKYDNIFASTGIHPHYADDNMHIDSNKLIKLADHPKVIGLGETGLDYYYAHSNKENQKTLFVEHINSSKETGIPIIVHTRDADSDTIDILTSEMKDKPFPGLIHCFSGSEELAFKSLDLGLYISISGIITFKNAESIRSIVEKIPLDRILVETDSPYLAPVPMRGKRAEPAFTRFVAEKIAEIKNINQSEVFQTTTENFFKLFTKAKK